MGSQAWSNDDSQISNAKRLIHVKSNTSMHQAISKKEHKQLLSFCYATMQRLYFSLQIEAAPSNAEAAPSNAEAAQNRQKRPNSPRMSCMEGCFQRHFASEYLLHACIENCFATWEHY